MCYGNITEDISYYFYQDVDVIEEEQKRQKMADFLKSVSYKLNEDIQIEIRMTNGNKTVQYNLENGQKAMDIGYLLNSSV